MKKNIKLIDLDCANCAAKIEDAVKKIDGVTNASVSFMAQKMTLEAPDEIFPQVFDEAKKLIHKLEPDITIK
ncbi:MAG TPA: cation transporter [Candidatus Megamonas gallistercoris]|nr:cation transporter [Candidatus Megamonas gallistercoris]